MQKKAEKESDKVGNWLFPGFSFERKKFHSSQDHARRRDVNEQPAPLLFFLSFRLMHAINLSQGVHLPVQLTTWHAFK
jgi:hypothetical protein